MAIHKFTRIERYETDLSDDKIERYMKFEGCEREQAVRDLTWQATRRAEPKGVEITEAEAL